MSASDPVNFFPFAFPIESDRSQNRRQYHSWTVNPGQSLVHADGPVSFGSRNLGCADSKVSAGEIQVSRRRAESKMGPAIGGTGALAACEDPGNDRRDYRPSRYQTELLMHLEHVGPFVEPRLILRASLGLRR